MLPALARSYVQNGLLASRAGWGIVLRGLPEQLRDSLGGGGGDSQGRGRTAPDLRLYPAHLHMAVHPEHQRRGIGGALLETLLERLTAAGVPGIHLTTTNHHRAAAAMYVRHGFAELARQRTRVFDHLLPAAMLPVERIVMGRRLRPPAASALTAPPSPQSPASSRPPSR
jgi:GNAT superfamily N-acetyltransferase